MGKNTLNVIFTTLEALFENLSKVTQPFWAVLNYYPNF